MKPYLIAIAAGLMLQPLHTSAQQTLAATLEVYVFPNAGQDSSQQSIDESACYDYAVTNVGTDPFEAQKQQQAAADEAAAQSTAAQESTKGAGAKGAVRGAAVGAVVGEVADDDAGKGAAYGAAAGAIHGRRKSRREAEETTEQAQAQQQSASQASAKDIENFKKAFSVCLEAKNYTVKF